MKRCTICGESKDFSHFYKSTRYKDGYGYRCKPCDAEVRRRSRNGEGGKGTRDGFRRRNLMERYGLTVEEYSDKLAEQDHKCAICGTDNPDGEGQKPKKQAKSFAVDHDHANGKVRGLLCNLCNRALGFLQDNPTVVKAAWVYLDGHKQAGCH